MTSCFWGFFRPTVQGMPHQPGQNGCQKTFTRAAMWDHCAPLSLLQIKLKYNLLIIFDILLCGFIILLNYERSGPPVVFGVGISNWCHGAQCHCPATCDHWWCAKSHHLSPSTCRHGALASLSRSPMLVPLPHPLHILACSCLVGCCVHLSIGGCLRSGCIVFAFFAFFLHHKQWDASPHLISLTRFSRRASLHESHHPPRLTFIWLLCILAMAAT